MRDLTDSSDLGWEFLQRRRCFTGVCKWYELRLLSSKKAWKGVLFDGGRRIEACNDSVVVDESAGICCEVGGKRGRCVLSWAVSLL